MEELWAQIYPHLLEAVITVVIAAIGIISTWAINALRKRFDTEADFNRKCATSFAIDLVEATSDIVVRELEQTIVPKIKEALADGKLTEEEAKNVKALAIERVKNYIKFDLNSANLDPKIIESAVEAAIHRIKKDA